MYEGRGWGVEGGHTCCLYYNRIGHAIAFIGDYTTTSPTAAMLNTAQNLIQCGVDRVRFYIFPSRIFGDKQPIS